MQGGEGRSRSVLMDRTDRNLMGRKVGLAREEIGRSVEERAWEEMRLTGKEGLEEGDGGPWRGTWWKLGLVEGMIGGDGGAAIWRRRRRQEGCTDE